MRRTVVTCVLLAAFAVPATALGLRLAPGDGTLVVKNGSAPRGSAVVTLVIRGAAIGQITGGGKIVIEDLTPDNGSPPEVTGFGWHKSVDPVGKTGDTFDVWGGTDTFRFRAVGDTYRITIYGSGVGLVASGSGNAIVTGSPDVPTRDGSYSLNGNDFRSLPATPTKLQIGTTTSATATG
jgi:hypothetical protein